MLNDPDLVHQLVDLFSKIVHHRRRAGSPKCMNIYEAHVSPTLSESSAMFQ